MTDAPDFRDTVFLPKTDFPMKAGLAAKEPAILERWAAIGLYERLRKERAGRERFLLHDGPPYANGDIHMGHAMNKILKDIVVRSQSLMGKDAPYIPGWDCHGLPIEWKIEEQYRAKKRSKDEVPPAEFRAECRAGSRGCASGCRTGRARSIMSRASFTNRASTSSRSITSACSPRCRRRA